MIRLLHVSGGLDAYRVAMVVVGFAETITHEANMLVVNGAKPETYCTSSRPRSKAVWAQV